MSAMTDRELLELAARAAGYQIDFTDWRDCGGWTDYRKIPGGYWNPLVNDGDALRLACQLSIDVIVRTISVIAGDASPGGKVVTVECGGRPNGREVAARRAIVQAAARIGKDKPQ